VKKGNSRAEIWKGAFTKRQLKKWHRSNRPDILAKAPGGPKTRDLSLLMQTPKLKKEKTWEFSPTGSL